MQITALVDNISYDQALGAEHGLSFYIETGAHKILFDMGQSGLFAENAKKLGIDLAAVDIAVLSHGHYDHGGGLRRFLQINQKAPVYLSRYAFNLFYHGPEKYIGLDQSLKKEAPFAERLLYVEDRMTIGDGLTLYPGSHIPRGSRQLDMRACPPGSLLHGNDRRDDRTSALDGSGLDMEVEGERLPDTFCHEQYLLAEEEGKRILFSGCSHKGILDITEQFRPDVLIGGFHFSKLPLDDTLAGYAGRLDRTGTVFYTGHCTGKAQFDFMKSYMERLHYLSVGRRIVTGVS